MVSVNSLFAQFTNIPDPYFEQVLVDQSIDSDSLVNGQILTSDITGITDFALPQGNVIVDLTGIEDFESLQNLVVHGSYLQILNLSSNSNLKSLKYLGGNQIASLDLATNTNLEILEIYGIYSLNINISGCANLKRLGSYAPLIGLNVQNNINLEFLYLTEFPNASIDLSQNSNLSELYIGYFVNVNNYSNTIILPNNSNLKKIALSGTSNAFLNVSGCPLLELLSISAPLEYIDLSNNSNLKNLTLGYTLLTELDVSNQPLLETLGCVYSSLSFLDVSNNPLLRGLNCSHNLIESLYVGENPLLEVLYCNDNSLTSLNVNNNPLLNELSCKNNNLNSLSVQNGNNALLNGTVTDNTTRNRFDSTNNPNLSCIFVDDIANCSNNWLGVDSVSNFVTTIQECQSLSISEFILQDISIFPNPVDNILNIENNTEKTIKKVNLYNAFGNLVLSKEKFFIQLDLSSLVSGLYFLSVQSENESKVFKVVKK